MARVTPKADPGAKPRTKRGAAAAAPATAAAPAPRKAPAVHTPSKGNAADSAARRALMLAKLGKLDEHPASKLANNYVERTTPSGSVVIDEVLGLRGIPAHGRMLQVHGEEHSGKSTLLYHLAGVYQRTWDRPVWIWDIEGQLETSYLWQCGLNPDPTMTILRQTTDVNEILRNTFQMMGDGRDMANVAVDYFIFDSVACMIPPVSDEDILKGKALNHSVGDQAKMFKRFMQILQPRARMTDSHIHFVNQMSSIIPKDTKEQMAMKYASITRWDYTITGGKAARYFPSIMLMTAKDKAFEGAGKGKDAALERWLFPAQGEGKDKVGVGRNWDYNRSKLRVLKNKVNNGGYREHHIWIRPGGGIDDNISVRELAYHYGMLKSVGGKCYIGQPSAPIATFATIGEAIQAIVVEQRQDLLDPLRAAVVEAIRQDDPRTFAYERTQEDRYAAGETDEAPVSLRELELEDDFPGSDDSMGLDPE